MSKEANLLSAPACPGYCLAGNFLKVFHVDFSRISAKRFIGYVDISIYITLIKPGFISDQRGWKSELSNS
jgi:hypothetical protein